MITFNVKQKLKDVKKEQDIYRRIQDLRKLAIYVGIPEESTERKNKKSEKDEMNNATLLLIHTKGSPLRKLPARPLIEPALEERENQEKISQDMRDIAKAALDNKFDLARRYMNTTGQHAENMVKDWFEDPRNNWAPNAPSTIERKGSDLPMIDTGELRKSIKYVVREKE